MLELLQTMYYTKLFQNKGRDPLSFNIVGESEGEKFVNFITKKLVIKSFLVSTKMLMKWKSFFIYWKRTACVQKWKIYTSALEKLIQM